MLTINELSDKVKSVSIHKRNLQAIATEKCKVTKGLVPDIFFECFWHKKQLNYNLRHASYFDVPLKNSVLNVTENISFLESTIWDTLLNEIKEMKTVEEFKGVINNGSRKIACVDFVSAVWLGSDLSDTYFQG